MEIAFSSNLQYAKLQNFLPIRLNHSAPSEDTKISKFLLFNFSRYNFEKLIRALHACTCTHTHTYTHLHTHKHTHTHLTWGDLGNFKKNCKWGEMEHFSFVRWEIRGIFNLSLRGARGCWAIFGGDCITSACHDNVGLCHLWWRQTAKM